MSTTAEQQISLHLPLQDKFHRRELFSEDPQCAKGYCATGSLCQPNSGGSLPFCLCPLNRFGARCSMEHDACLSNPCENNGSCFADSRPDQVICLCTKTFLGAHCQWERPSIHLPLSSNLSYQGAVIQFLQIDFISLHLIRLDQHVFLRLPQQIEYFHSDPKSSIADIVLARLYSSHQQSIPDLYLLSVHLNLFSFAATTQISSINRCEHTRTFSNGIIRFF